MEIREVIEKWKKSRDWNDAQIVDLLTTYLEFWDEGETAKNLHALFGEFSYNCDYTEEAVQSALDHMAEQKRKGIKFDEDNDEWVPPL